jgi:hypothetical protein
MIDYTRSFLEFNTKHLTFAGSKEFSFYFRFSITAYNFIFASILFLLLINLLTHFFFKQISSFVKITFYINVVGFISIISVALLKFFMSLKFESIVGTYFYVFKLEFYKNNSNLKFAEHYTVISNSFSDSILILSLVIG